MSAGANRQAACFRRSILFGACSCRRTGVHFAGTCADQHLEAIMIRKSRREGLVGAAALAGTAALPRSASAQSKGRIVVGTWGGDYARLLHKNIEVPILIKDGWDVGQDQAGDPDRRPKQLAE